MFKKKDNSKSNLADDILTLDSRRKDILRDASDGDETHDRIAAKVYRRLCSRSVILKDFEESTGGFDSQVKYTDRFNNDPKMQAKALGVECKDSEPNESSGESINCPSLEKR